MSNDKGVKAPKSNKERQAKLKLYRASKGIFKRTFWVTNVQHIEMKITYEKLINGDSDENSI